MLNENYDMRYNMLFCIYIDVFDEYIDSKKKCSIRIVKFIIKQLNNLIILRKTYNTKQLDIEFDIFFEMYRKCNENIKKDVKEEINSWNYKNSYPKFVQKLVKPFKIPINFNNSSINSSIDSFSAIITKNSRKLTEIINEKEKIGMKHIYSDSDSIVFVNSYGQIQHFSWNNKPLIFKKDKWSEIDG